MVFMKRKLLCLRAFLSLLILLSFGLLSCVSRNYYSRSFGQNIAQAAMDGVGFIVENFDTGQQNRGSNRRGNFAGDNRMNVIQGSRVFVTEERDLPFFNAITLEHIGNINIHHANESRVVITAEDNILPFVVTQVINNSLHVSMDTGDNHNRFNTERIIFDVYMPQLANISVAGVGQIHIAEGSAENLSISVSGSASIFAENYIVENARIKISGHGNIDLSVTNFLDIESNGAGTISALNIPVERANISVGSAGSVQAWVSNSLNASVRDVGRIRYKGEPITHLQVRGFGRINRL
jgi:hypothetical protein